MRENIYMLPSNMNFNIRSGTVGYNSKILVYDGKFSLGKNEKVNALEARRPPGLSASQVAIRSHAQTATTHRDLAQKPTITHKNQERQTITHEDEKIALELFLAGGFAIWNMF